KILHCTATLGENVRCRSIIGHGPKREFDSKQTAAKLDEIAGPTHRYCHVADRVFENQIPANDPCDYFTERGVAVRIGRTGTRNHRRELSVTKRRETAGDSGDDK